MEKVVFSDAKFVLAMHKLHFAIQNLRSVINKVARAMLLLTSCNRVPTIIGRHMSAERYIPRNSWYLGLIGHRNANKCCPVLIGTNGCEYRKDSANKRITGMKSYQRDNEV
jgi:hypothetical protein